MRILVTDGGRGASRSALATVRALRVAGYAVAVTTRAGQELAAHSRGVVARLPVPAATEAEAYARAIADLEDREGFDLVIPTSDAALVALARPEARLVDKAWLRDACLAHGLPTPPSVHFASVDSIDEKAAAELDWPVVVKPVVGSAPAVRVEDYRELAQRLDAAARRALGAVIVQPFQAGGMTAIAGLHWQGRLRAVVHQRYLRCWPVDCGPACAAISSPPDPIREKALLRLLDGYDGIFQAQYLGEELIDLNPRPYGSMPLATAAGVSLPALLCSLVAERASGVAPAVLESPLRGRVGVRYRWLEGDLRHLARRVRRGEASLLEVLRAARPRSGTAHSVVSLRDPGPLLMRARQVLRAAFLGAW